MNSRIDLNNKLVDDIIKDDKINDLINQYKNELDYYDYVDTVEKFSILSLKGSMKYINKYDKKLRIGGLLIKIYKNNNDYYGIIKKINNKKYFISFKNNYIFYLKTKDELFKKSLECFISSYNIN